MCKKCLMMFIIFACAVIAASLFLWNETNGAEPTIRINEIAWMGTEASANDEWVELLNASDVTIDLAGWQLRAKDGSPEITLAGSIPPGGYMLLERTDDSTVPAIAAYQIYTGALANDGEMFELVNAEGFLQDRVDGSSGWPAGDNKGKATMERNDDGIGWHTGPALGTPRAQNSSLAPLPIMARKEEKNIPSAQTYREPKDATPSWQNHSPALEQKHLADAPEEHVAQGKNGQLSSSSVPSILADLGTSNAERFARDLQKISGPQSIPPFFIAGGIVLSLIIAASIGIVLVAQRNKII